MAEFHKTSDFFTAFRKTYGFPNFYREQPLDWFREVGMWGVGVGYITVVLAITVIIAFLGTRGYSRWRITLQMVISLGIGFSIILCVTGVNWQICDYEWKEDGDTLKYKVHIGLYQANITMARMLPESSEYSEYHNVKIGWREVYQAEEEYREALMRGWPVGILRVARYISADTEGMRYMRSFRWSGYAAWILLWSAFTSWLLANVLMGANVSYSAAFLLLTGGLQLLACIVYNDQSPTNFYIPMDDGSGNKLRLRYDWMYWLSLFMGLFVILMAAIILILDYLRPADMNKFFGTISEFHSPYEDELTQNQNKDIKGMIRQISQKRPRADSKRQVGQNGLDVENSSKTAPYNMYERNGAENPAFLNSMTSIHEGEERGDPHLAVPDIQVEMVDVESSAANDSHALATDDVDIHTYSDPSDPESPSDTPIQSPTKDMEGIRLRASNDDQPPNTDNGDTKL